MSLLEFAVDKRKETALFSRATVISFLVRTAGSGALFLLAHNFFLAMLYYLTSVIASTPQFRERIGNISKRITKLS